MILQIGGITAKNWRRKIGNFYPKILKNRIRTQRWSVIDIINKYPPTPPSRQGGKFMFVLKNLPQTFLDPHLEAKLGGLTKPPV